MFTNGRSSSAPRAFIQTDDEKRRQIWQHVFGSDTLPVIGDGPRFQVQQGRAFEIYAYDLALHELTAAQRARFAGYLSRKCQMEYQTILRELETAVSWPIKATADIRVVEPAGQTPSLASLLQQLGRKVPRPLFRFGW